MKLTVLTFCALLLTGGLVQAEESQAISEDNSFGVSSYFAGTEYPGFKDPENIADSLADIEPSADKEITKEETENDVASSSQGKEDVFSLSEND